VTMKRTRLFFLIEGYLDGTSTAGEREELAAAVAADPARREVFVAQVRLARQLRAALRPRAAASTWDKIARLTTDEDTARRQRIADRVDVALDSKAARPPRTSRGLWVGGAVLAAAAIVFLVVRPDRDRDHDRFEPSAAAPPPGAALSTPPPLPGAAAEDSPPGATPVARAPAAPPASSLPESPPRRPPASPEPPAATRAALEAEMVAAGEPALTARADVLQYLGFDVPRPLRAVRGRLRPRFTQLVAGFSGTGLRTYFHRDQGGLRGGGARVFIAASALTGTAAPDELHLRYYVRLSEGFDFAGGGILPGLCLGDCTAGVVAVRPRGAVVRPRWSPMGELSFDPLPGRRPAEGRWRGILGRGTWHCIELRVKLNTPGGDDGEVEGWLDGARAVSLAGLRLRDTADTRLQGVWFQTMYRGGAARPPARDGDATFDNLAVAGRYVGPRTPP
jgi:hypothetical protein